MNYIRLEDEFFNSRNLLIDYIKSVKTVNRNLTMLDYDELFEFPNLKIKKYQNRYFCNFKGENFEFDPDEYKLQSLINDCQLKFDAFNDYIVSTLPYEGMTINCRNYPSIKVTVDHTCDRFNVSSNKDISFEREEDWNSISDIIEWIDKIEDLFIYDEITY